MAIEMDEETKKHIDEMEKNFRFPTGIGRIDRGDCPLGSTNPMACMFCLYGHMLECHHPYTYEEAECSHYQDEADAYPDYDPQEE